MIAADKKLSDFEIFLMADNEMMEKIKDALQNINLQSD